MMEISSSLPPTVVADALERIERLKTSRDSESEEERPTRERNCVVLFDSEAEKSLNVVGLSTWIAHDRSAQQDGIVYLL
jgi:hypothetical protein